MAMERELLKHVTKKPATHLYPFEKFEPVEGMRAKIEIDMEKCIGCGTCVFDCPAFALEMIGRGLTCDMKWYPMRCVYCGQCVESCPRNAIRQTQEFTLASTRKEELICEFKRARIE
jgi:formate hydrogenlyase subunit 6/NADH:ubiquinone oxidoreductase subunit I